MTYRLSWEHFPQHLSIFLYTNLCDGSRQLRDFFLSLTPIPSPIITHHNTNNNSISGGLVMNDDQIGGGGSGALGTLDTRLRAPPPSSPPPLYALLWHPLGPAYPISYAPWGPLLLRGLYCICILCINTRKEWMAVQWVRGAAIHCRGWWVHPNHIRV